MSDDLKHREEAKRERHWDPAVRWRVIQETITWAEAQLPVPRNSKEACLREQARKLDSLAARVSTSPLLAPNR